VTPTPFDEPVRQIQAQIRHGIPTAHSSDMKCRLVRHRNVAFTVLEFAVVLVTGAMLFFVVLMLTPSYHRPKGSGLRVKCTTNLKQVALSYALWSNDNEQGLPMETPASKGGIRESALAGDLLPAVRIASNQMRTPSILICPAEKKRKAAETFANLTTANISYFLNIDAAITNQNQILAGDRNLAIAGSRVKSGPLQITNAWEVQWTNWLHSGGNVALIDGSAHQVTTKGLQDVLTAGGPTNRLIIP
jgi:hypothetical protein